MQGLRPSVTTQAQPDRARQQIVGEKCGLKTWTERRIKNGELYMKGQTKCILLGTFVCASFVPAVSEGNGYTLDLLQPRGGDPAPAANPPIVELLIHGGHVSEDSLRLSVDGRSADFDPAFDGIDNDGDGLLDEASEGIMSYPAASQTRFCARWPWALESDDAATPDVNEGLHLLNVRFGPPVGQEIEIAVRFAVYDRGGLDSLIVYPSPFDPGEEKARVAFRTFTDGAVKIDVLDFQGRTVMEIADWSELFPGWHQDPAHLWDGRDDNGDVVGNGVYFIRVAFKAGTFTEERIEKCFLAQ
jgi:hypothetical protein